MTITNGYLTQAEALAYVGQNLVQDTSLLDDVVTSSSRMIDRYCGREFFQVTEARTFATPDDIYTLSFGSYNDLVSVTTFNMRQNTVEITGVWGWPSVPLDVKQACRIIVAEISKMQESPLGVAGFGEFGVMRVSKTMPPRAMQLLAPYRHGHNFGIA